MIDGFNWLFESFWFSLLGLGRTATEDIRRWSWFQWYHGSHWICVCYCRQQKSGKQEGTTKTFVQDWYFVIKFVQRLFQTLDLLWNCKQMKYLQKIQRSNRDISQIFLIIFLQVYEKLLEAEKILHSLDQICKDLLPVAKRGAMLYAVISSLRGIQREYQFSLPFFLWMFDQAVGDEQKESQDDLEQGQVCSGHRLLLFINLSRLKVSIWRHTGKTLCLFLATSLPSGIYTF